MQAKQRRAFRRDTRANVAVISALAMMPIVITAGGALDLILASNKISEARQATHSAVLALANLNNTDSDVSLGGPGDSDYTSYVENMMRAVVTNYDSMHFSDFDVEYENEVGYKNFTIAIEGYVETNFLRLAGVDKIPFDYSASAAQRVQTAEISLVLDVSSSMSGSRIVKLRDASKGFVDLVLGSSDDNTVTISVVPYGGTVNVGPHVFNKLAADLADPNTILDPTEAQYDLLDDEHQTQKYRFTSDYYCLEVPTDDYVDPDAPMSDNNYTQVPNFWHYRNFNAWCPTRGAESVFVSNDTDALHTVLDRMSLSDGTGTDYGAYWGYQALSPTWQGDFDSPHTSRPLAYNAATNLKTMIIMTDGGITGQFRTEDPNLDSTHIGVTSALPRDYDQQIAGSNSGKNSQNRKTLYDRGSTNSSNNFGFVEGTPRDQAVDRFLRICHHAREQNIIVYTISFQVNESSWANQLMKACASDEGKHYLVDDLDLESAFSSIAGSISSLRITG